MLTLSATDSLSGVAGTAAAVTYTLYGDKVATIDSFQVLAQGQLSSSTGTIYPATASTQTLIKSITLANTTGSPVTGIKLFVNGTAAGNQIISLAIPANGSAEYNEDGWKIYDATGTATYASTTALSGDIIGSGSGTITTNIAAGVVTNAKLTTMPAHTYKGNNTGSTATPIDVTATQLTADLNLATPSLQGLMSAADKVEHDNWFGAAVFNVKDYGVTGNGSTDDLTAINTLIGTTAPDKSIIFFPSGTYLISGAISIPSGRHMTLRGAGQSKTIIQSTSQTANFVTVSDWYNTFESITFQSTQTATTGASQNLASLPGGVLNVGSTTNFPTSGSVYVGTTLGWKLVSYTGKSGSTLTGCSASTGLTVGTGAAGEQLALSSQGSVIFKTAGYVIDSSTMTNIFIKDCSWNGAYNGWNNQATLCGISGSNTANTINIDLTFNSTSVNAYVSECTMDGLPAAAAHVNVLLAGSLIISQCDFIRAVNNMLINPTTSGAFSIYSVNTFFDTAFGSSIKIAGTSDVQRLKFTNCWMSGSVNGIEFAGATGSNSTTAVDIVNCDIYSNSANGILATTIRDFSVVNSRIANNTTAGINITANAGSGVTKFNIQNNAIGPTGISTPGAGANGTGIIIAAGTYGGYIITGNNISGNTTAAVTDGGTVANADKQINGNLGMALGSSPMLSTPATFGNTETIVHQLKIPANGFQVGTTFRVYAFGIITATGPTLTAKLRIGTVGTIAGDTLNFTTPAVPVATTTGWQLDGLVTVRSLTTIIGNMTIHGTAPGKSIVTATVALTATSQNFLTLTLQGGGTTPVVTVVQASISVL